MASVAIHRVYKKEAIRSGVTKLTKSEYFLVHTKIQEYFTVSLFNYMCYIFRTSTQFTKLQ